MAYLRKMNWQRLRRSKQTKPRRRKTEWEPKDGLFLGLGKLSAVSKQDKE